MRRWLCTLQIGVLIAVLWPGVASASLNGFDPQPVDLSAQLFARCFGESTDRLASYDAVDGDTLAETPLRELAFRVEDIVPAAPPAAAVQLPTPAIGIADAAFAAPVQTASIPAISTQLRVPAVAYYQDVAPVPTDAPATHRFDLSGLHVDATQAFTAASFGAATPSTLSEGLQIPLRVGHVQFAPHAEAGTTTLGAGATLDVRAGKRDLGVDLSSALTHSTLSAPEFSATSTSGTSPLLGLTGSNLPVFVPAYADVSTHTLSTGLTVPVTRSLTANLQYDQQHLLGAYGAPGISNLDANNTIYGAQLTFNLPRSSSAISLSTRQYRYQDNIVPANALTQTNTNLNFTIKF
ncbi:MAG TPA: hypothetical protein VMF11_02080 [Candidatus Baltobacteraceae bacterium]|nr:hypothetical protein [Candidatus Baltobacteraceae bacterium]